MRLSRLHRNHPLVLAAALLGVLCTLTVYAFDTPFATAARVSAAHPFDTSTAISRRVTPLTETAHLRLVSSNEFALNERGQTSGTIVGPVTIHLTITSTRITATFKISPRGGSISGHAAASFKVVGSRGYFGGTLQVTHGSGSYRHASGTGIGVSGIINRQNFDLTVHVNGKLHL